MYGYIYETTCSVNNKKYIGQHKGVFDSSYLGSGIALTQAVKKYGRDKFTVTVICYAETRNDLNRLEIEFIEKVDAVRSKSYYNMAHGGEGGDTYTGTGRIRLGHVHSDEWKHHISVGNKGKRLGLVESEEIRQKKSESHRGLVRITKDGKGTWVSEDEVESYRQRGFVLGGVSINSGDSHFMRKRAGLYCWMNNGINDIRIEKSEAEKYISMGYQKGRVYKPRKKRSTTIESIT